MRGARAAAPPSNPPSLSSLLQAVLVADYKDEKLLTMAAPEDRPELAKLKDEITVPTALVTQAVGDRLKKAAKAGRVLVELDWSDSVAHPDSRVEWELWSSADDGCGPACDRQVAFIRGMAERAAGFEQGGYTQVGGARRKGGTGSAVRRRPPRPFLLLPPLTSSPLAS